MKVNTYPINELLSPLRQYFQKDDFKRDDVNNRPPLRSELFSLDQLDQHATVLANSHKLSDKKSAEQLLKKLSENEEIITKVTDLLHKSLIDKKVINPAGDWLLDNFYLIEEQIVIAKRHLPKGYSKALPKLLAGKSVGLPRVYDIALEIISHSDGHVNIESLTTFIHSYQKINHLTLGELWAVPIMLRLALIENLRRVAARLAVDSIDADLANTWSTRIIMQVEKNPKDLILTIGDMARSNPPIVSAFVANFVRKLQLQGMDFSLPIYWIEQHLSDTGHTINTLVESENQQQAADQVSMSNSINSLRFLMKTDWRDFVELVSVVEQTLRTDLYGVYSKMDFYTRDRYRHAVEFVAKNSLLTEMEVAKLAIAFSTANPSDETIGGRNTHVGYFLIGNGIKKLEKAAKVKLTIWQSYQRFVRKNSYFFYVSTAVILTLAGSAFLFSHVTQPFPAAVLACILMLFAIISSHLTMALVNWQASLLVTPKPLPKLNFSKGVPDEFRTLVVVPTILSDPAQVEKLLEELEVRFLSNRDPNLLFGLLTDFKDSLTQYVTNDDSLITLAKTSIEELNSKYGRLKNDTFFLFHRARSYNAKDHLWMGYERKRGKLAELNHLLRGKGRDRFSVIIGEEGLLKTVRYVITLDSDTQLPREAAWKLVGLMAHPLNQALYSNKKKKITDGYGIIQPRLATSLLRATRSPYSKMHENDSGIDPYTRVTSDVYQDVFAEGSFIGKGIYDVDAFEKVTDNRFPENRILSHDLLEGAYARCGFASEVQFYEEDPASYKTDVDRRHRWIRGDWQIAAWALPMVPDSKKKFHKNPLNALSRWKIVDNLRRSLLPLAFLTVLVMGWTIFSNVWFWTLVVTGAILFPSIIISIWAIVRKAEEISFSQHFFNVSNNIAKSTLQTLFSVAMMPYEAYKNFDSIFRTLWRISISGRKLLEWNPSGFAQGRVESLASSLKSMWFAPFSATAIALLITQFNPIAIWPAAVFLVLWFVSPILAWWVSKPAPVYDQVLDESQKLTLRELSRRTWAFFEDLVGPTDNWLPPDNQQLYPIPVIAHRTSPTNIGLSLLSNLAAHDFGYITTTQLLARTANTFETLEKMERHAGHLYNWYDTKTLAPLHPKYISTVDSGNFAGHLLTLRQGLFELRQQKIINVKIFDGMHDTIRIILQQSLEGKHASFLEFQKSFEHLVADMSDTLDGIYAAFQTISQNLHQLMQEPIPSSEANQWIQALESQLTNALAEINLFAPWIAEPALLDAVTNKDIWLENYTITDFTTRSKPFTNSAHGSDSLYQEKMENSGATDIQLTDVVKLVDSRIHQILHLADTCLDFADLEFDFLYDKTQHLLSIGYNADHHRRDEGYYDLLASEARLSIFLAIAQGKLPQESWFALGRRLTSAGNTSVLLSWSGSMFEFLMPNLVMPTYRNTLLDTTSKGSVKRQIEYGKQQNVPWGISESCYNMVDSNLTYQYKAFGVPGLGFKRGLGQDLVIAPYASVMALMIEPLAAFDNLQKLLSEGYHGKYGYFEAIDYTPARLPRAKSKIVIQSFMAHHQGMGFLSLAYLLLDKPMQRRFEADTSFQTALLLLQERIPKSTGYYISSSETEDVKPDAKAPEIRTFRTASTPIPEVQLLSNGKYHVMVTNSGSGYSRWKDIALTRWREDTTSDNWGSYTYIRNLNTSEYWSAAYQPSLKEGTYYNVVFAEGRAEFTRVDNDLETYTEIIVSPEDDIEIRRSKITNLTNTTQSIEVTSYAEVVIASSMADDAHTAFSNLFVQTKLLKNQEAIMCTRRPRSDQEHPPFMLHMMKIKGGENFEVSYETDRNIFIGRGNTLENPAALTKPGPLTNSEGSVLDPIVSIRYTFTLNSKESAVVDVITGIADTRENGQLLIDKYQDRHLRDRAFELSFTHTQVVLRQINASEADAQLFNRLASPMIYANPLLRTSQATLIKNLKGQSGLWSYSISGDIPILLVEISDTTKIALVKQLIQARSYWQSKGLIADLVIINKDPSSYRQELQEQIQAIIAGSSGLNPGEKQGGIFVRSADQIPAEDFVLLQTAARAIIVDSNGTLLEQLNKTNIVRLPFARLNQIKTYSTVVESFEIQPDLKLFNGTGGFSSDGKEYIIITDLQQRTPLPWSNVIANKTFGTVVTESGSSYTWRENAHSYRLTPWHNDPVRDLNGEAIYIRDAESGAFWSPSPLPARGMTPYVTRHGFGYTIFEHTEDGISSELCISVDAEVCVKFMTLKIKNNSGRHRKLSATAYVEWVLGSIRARSGMYTVTERHPRNGALLARNAYNTEFTNHVSFLHTDETNISYTTDRSEFIGRNGNMQNPQGLKNIKLSDKSGAGLDACAAIQVAFDLDNGNEKEIIFKLGAGRDLQDANELIQRFIGRNATADSLHNVHRFWSHTLGGLQITTPDTTLNFLANGWLVYQVLSCRLWGRSGFYQSGGAFGFRDQLQDVMSLIHADPALTRQQILLSASRQFPEGDVQHWWHPPLGRGVRTLCSDDYLWLPYVTSRYVMITGDSGVLNELVTFIDGRKLNDHEESYYDLPVALEHRETLYEHCKRSVLHGLRFGERGLPLMGSGDWNDGMNIVGIEGKGESVWLAWFVYDVLLRFSKIAAVRGDHSFVDDCLKQAEQLKMNIHKNAWDGEWYVRAYFDDGTPLGSSKNTECRIDAISQSWSVLSEAGDAERSLEAMESVNKHLVNRQKGLIQLLDPPFDKSDPDPGYIRGYVPGVRENGGQYTHAAIWTVMAFAKLGNQARTYELLSLINPLNHGLNAADIASYKAEPYVMAADVYGVAPHTGRGGWTWYTGSAGWMYMLIVESFLGLKREGNLLYFEPCIPADWKSFSIQYRFHATMYTIEVNIVKTNSEVGITMEGEKLQTNGVLLKDDLKEHVVKIGWMKDEI